MRSVANVWPSYIFGKVYAHGVWFYFPVCLRHQVHARRCWLCCCSTAFAIATRQDARRSREVLFLTIPPVIYMLVSMTSQLNIGVRHILLVFVFCCVLAAGGAWALDPLRSPLDLARGRAARCCTSSSSARAFPTSYMAYSNELWGGPSATYKHLTDSNTDWGQQLKA